MVKPRTAASITCAAILSFCFLYSGAGVSVHAQAAQTEAVAQDTTRGIELYRNGDTKGAIETLQAVVKQRKDDAYAWHYLGLALLKEGNVKASRKAFETAVKSKPDFILAHVSLARVLISMTKWRDAARAAERLLAVDPRNAEAHYMLGAARLGAGSFQKALQEADAAMSIDSGFAPAYLLKSRVVVANLEDRKTASRLSEKEVTRLFKTAATNLERYIQLSPDDPQLAHWREQLEALKIYAGVYDLPTDQREVFTTDEVTTKARVLYKPEPGYTEEARKNQVTGTVTLRAILSAGGTVKNIFVVSSLGHGLTDKCIEAARNIKFLPATKDGRRVSQVVTIEYNFNLY